MKTMVKALFVVVALTVSAALAAPPVKPAAPPPPPLPAVLLPYLQNPTADGMTVCFLAQGAERVRVAWNLAGKAELTEVAAASIPIPGTSWTAWRARLTTLSPGTGYQYQVRYTLAGKRAETATYHFRTLDPKAKTVRFVQFNDLHNQDGTLAALMRHVKPEDYEFSLLVGDCWGDTSAAKGADGVFRTLEAYLRLLDAADKPMVFVRGNHETRGNFSHQMAKLFDLPNLDATQKWGDDQWQFTLRAGPVWMLAMDTGEDDDFTTPEKSYKAPKFWQAFRQREAAWLKTLAATKPGRDAAWRIFVSHIPLYNNNNDFSVPSRQYWEPLLREMNLDLMLAAHDHACKMLPAKAGAQPPWPVIIGGGPAINQGVAVLVAADEKTLRARLLSAKDGHLLTEFTAEAPKNSKP